MPKQLLHLESDAHWLHAIVRPHARGMETELHFRVNENDYFVTFDVLPSPEFLIGLVHMRNLSVYERSLSERGWVESGRFEVLLNDDDDHDCESVLCDEIRWGPGGKEF